MCVCVCPVGTYIVVPIRCRQYNVAQLVFISCTFFNMDTMFMILYTYTKKHLQQIQIETKRAVKSLKYLTLQKQKRTDAN